MPQTALALWVEHGSLWKRFSPFFADIYADAEWPSNCEYLTVETLLHQGFPLRCPVGMSNARFSANLGAFPLATRELKARAKEDADQCTASR